MKIRPDEQMIVNGKLTQVGVSFQVPTKTCKKRHAVFQCQCGNRKLMFFDSVASGRTSSCGCLIIEALKNNKHNIGRIQKHGLTSTKAYHCWSNIIQRCRNAKHKHYANYGGRGITVCQEWADSFVAFFNHIGPPPSQTMAIDRIDNNRGYEPGNVRWVTKKENQRNRRVNVSVEFAGRKMSVAELAETIGMKDSVVRNRVKAGWTIEQIVGIPVGGKRNG